MLPPESIIKLSPLAKCESCGFSDRCLDVSSRVRRHSKKLLAREESHFHSDQELLCSFDQGFYHECVCSLMSLLHQRRAPSNLSPSLTISHLAIPSHNKLSIYHAQSPLISLGDGRSGLF